MKSNGTIPGTEEAWDSRALGSDPNFAVLADASDEGAIDAALGLQPISIRLQKSLVEDFKLIAQLNGLGYQTLMRGRSSPGLPTARKSASCGRSPRQR